MPEVRIIVPSHLHEKLKKLAEFKQEINGFFVYTPDEIGGKTFWRVHSFHMLGRGSAEHVRARASHLNAANVFLQELRKRAPRAGYDFIKVHTHCRGTGEQWFHRFSKQDLEAVREELLENPGFTLMMYSPTHQIATGHPNNKYTVKVVHSQQHHLENNRKLDAIYDEARQREGITLPRFEAVRKRER